MFLSHACAGLPCDNPLLRAGESKIATKTTFRNKGFWLCSSSFRGISRRRGGAPLLLWVVSILAVLGSSLHCIHAADTSSNSWGIFKTIERARGSKGGEDTVDTGCHGELELLKEQQSALSEEKERLQDEVHTLRASLASAMTFRAEAERTAEEMRGTVAALQRERAASERELKDKDRLLSEEVRGRTEVEDALAASEEGFRAMLLEMQAVISRLQGGPEIDFGGAAKKPKSAVDGGSKGRGGGTGVKGEASGGKARSEDRRERRERGAEEEGRVAPERMAADTKPKADGNPKAAKTAKEQRSTPTERAKPKQAQSRGERGRGTVTQPNVKVTAELEKILAVCGEELHHVIQGYDGVLALGDERLYYFRQDLVEGVQEVPLGRIKTVTSSAQGHIQVVGSDSSTLLVGPPLSSFEVDRLGKFFEAVKQRVMAARKRAREEGASVEDESSREVDEVSDASKGGERGVGSDMATGKKRHEATEGTTATVVKQEEEEAEGGEDDGEWEKGVAAEYHEMQRDFCADWERQKGSACPSPSPSSHAHLLLLHGHLKCRDRSGHLAARSIRKAVSLDPGMLPAHLLLSKIYVGQGRFEQAQESLGAALALDPQNFQALTLLQLVQHLLGNDSQETGEEVCMRVKLFFLEQSISDISAVEQLCNFFDDDTWAGSLTDTAAEQLRRNRYVFLEDILPQKLVATLQQYYQSVIRRRHKIHFADAMRRWEFEEAPIANLINQQLTGLVRTLTGENVVPTYAFPVFYDSGGHISPHLDVIDNEISLTMQLEISPAEGEWPLLLEDPVTSELKGYAMRNNDGVLYRGTEVKHWRDKMPDSYKVMQLIFAWRVVNPAGCTSQ